MFRHQITLFVVHRLDDCTPMELDRYHTSLLKSIDFQSSPICTAHHRITSPTAAVNTLQSTTPLNHLSNSSVSLAKVTTIPRCRESIISNTTGTPKLTLNSTSTDNVHTAGSSTATFAPIPVSHEDQQMISFFQPISDLNISSALSSDVEYRKSNARPPLEAVPELSELHVANNRHSFAQSISSTIPSSYRSNSVQATPLLITFDSSSLQRRT